MYGDDTGYLDQNPDLGPDGPQTRQNAAGKWETTYILSKPLSPQEIAQIQASVQGAGEGGGISVTPDGMRMTITAAKSQSNLWKMLALAGGALATAGIAASLMGGSGAAAAANAGAQTIGTGGSGLLAATQTVPNFGMMTAGAVPTGMGAAAAAGGGAAAGAGIAKKAGLLGGSSLPGWAQAALKVGGPLAAGSLMSRGGSRQQQGLDPQMQSNFNELMRMATERQKRVDPLHQAAMAMATRMAPGYAQSAMGPSNLDQLFKK